METLLNESVYQYSTDILEELKETVNESGYWGGDYDNWNQIVAVCNLESMLAFGVTFDEKWDVKGKNGTAFQMSLNRVVSYLDSCIYAHKGTVRFGEDLWDMFRLANLINRYNLESRFSNYRKLHAYCKKIIKDKQFDIDTRWNGPAVMAVAYEFATTNNLNGSEEIIDKLLATQNSDGSWSDSRDDSPQMKVWHTSQVLRALSLAKKEMEFDNILKTIHECTMSKEFESDYFLSTYFFVYAALAYVFCNKMNLEDFWEVVNRGIIPKCQKKVWDRGASSMVAEYWVAYIQRSDLEIGTGIVNSLLLIKKMDKIIAQNDELKEQNAKLNKRLSDYKKYKTLYHIAKWAIVTILGAIITVIISNYIVG